MNNTLKKLFLTLVTCLSVSIVFAQENRADAEQACKMKAQQSTKELKGALNLSNEQQKQVLEILTYSEMKKVSHPGADSEVDLYITGEMNKVLTPSQMTTWLNYEAAKNPKVDPEKDTREHKE